MPEPTTDALNPAGGWQVTCLCAQWCHICGSYQGLFEEAGRRLPGVRLDWVDIEDDAQAMGEVDIETFPTLLIAHRGQALFLGPLEPTEAALVRLVTALQARADRDAPTLPQAQGLLERLSARLSQRPL